MEKRDIEPEDLLIHILNVGHGDNIIIEFPADDTGNRIYGVVDCFLYDKTRLYLDKLTGNFSNYPLEFVCATHPHSDHILSSSEDYVSMN